MQNRFYVYFVCLQFLLLSGTSTVGTKAFYIIFSNQIGKSNNPSWPEKVCQNNGKGPQGKECVDARQYKNGLFVASPQNMTQELIEQVKQDVPGSKVIGYFDYGDIPLAYDADECPFCKGHIMGDRPGRNCSTTYTCGPSLFLAALQKAFPRRLAVHDITDGLPGVMIESYPGLAKYVWGQESA